MTSSLQDESKGEQTSDPLGTVESSLQNGLKSPHLVSSLESHWMSYGEHSCVENCALTVAFEEKQENMNMNGTRRINRFILIPFVVADSKFPRFAFGKVSRQIPTGHQATEGV